MGNSCYIIWIDPCVNNSENTLYFIELKLNLNSKVKRFSHVESAIEFLKTIRFVETKVILSGKLYLKFIKYYERNLTELYTIPKIIIFTSQKERFINNIKMNQHILIDQNFNFGGIQTDFQMIKNFMSQKPNTASLQLKLNELKKIEKNEFQENQFTEIQSEQMTFDYIDSKEKLFLPIFYKTLIEMPKDSFQYYTLTLYEEFSKENTNIKKLLEQIIDLKNPPIEILCKYYIRAYTMQSNLFGAINKELRYNKIRKNLPFIKLLYEGLKLKSISLASNQVLYRGNSISNKEISKIKNYLANKKEGLPGAIVFSKSFLSFSKEKKIAVDFFGDKMKDMSRILFILNKDKNIDYSLATHADIEKISYYQYEREVLFFPFSSFEIKNVKKVKNKKYDFEIELLYLGKYINEFKKDKNLFEKAIKLPESKFKDAIKNLGLIQKEKIETVNTQNLFNNYTEYKKEINKKETLIKEDNNIQNESRINSEEISSNKININEININKINSKDNIFNEDNIEEDGEKIFIGSIIFLGDTKVGKTSIRKRYFSKIFNEKYFPTFNFEFTDEEILLHNINKIRLHIWDISGQEIDNPILSSFCTNIQVAILTYDITNKSSFINLDILLQKAKDEISNFIDFNCKDLLIFLVGNKCDANENERQVSKKEGLSFSEKYNMIFHEISAKTGKGVRELFADLLNKLEEKYIIKNH